VISTVESVGATFCHTCQNCLQKAGDPPHDLLEQSTPCRLLPAVRCSLYKAGPCNFLDFIEPPFGDRLFRLFSAPVMSVTAPTNSMVSRRKLLGTADCARTCLIDPSGIRSRCSIRQSFRSPGDAGRLVPARPTLSSGCVRFPAPFRRSAFGAGS